MILRLLKYLVIGLIGLAALGVYLETNKTPEEKAAENALKTAQKAQAAKEATEKARQESATLPSYTAYDLAKAYHNNTVAADQKFKDQKFKITGVITTINTNFSGDPYINLKGGVNFLMEPHVEFDANVSTDQIAKLNKGQKIVLVCTGRGDIAKAPLLHSCLIP